MIDSAIWALLHEVLLKAVENIQEVPYKSTQERKYEELYKAVRLQAWNPVSFARESSPKRSILDLKSTKTSSEKTSGAV